MAQSVGFLSQRQRPLSTDHGKNFPWPNVDCILHGEQMLNNLESINCNVTVNYRVHRRCGNFKARQTNAAYLCCKEHCFNIQWRLICKLFARNSLPTEPDNLILAMLQLLGRPLIIAVERRRLHSHKRKWRKQSVNSGKFNGDTIESSPLSRANEHNSS